MFTVTYYKLGHRWFLDLPEYIHDGGDPEQLERIGAFHDFLEWAARGETTVAFYMDEQPFEGADTLELTGSSGDRTGGYYHLHSFEGTPVDFELWYNSLLYIQHGSLPPRLYIRRAPLPRLGL